MAIKDDWADFIAGAAERLLESRKGGKPDPDSFVELMKTTPVVTPSKMFEAPKLTRERRGKSTFSEAFADFLNTPGYSSEDAGKAGGHDAYMEQLRLKGKAPLSKPFNPGKEADTFTMSEEAKLATELDDVADHITKHFLESPTKLMLNQPTKLTVKRATGQFSQKPHIGGEEFVPTRAYVGKRGQLIFTMRPADAADYVEAEFSEKQANELFDDFVAYMRLAPDLRDMVAEAKKAAADAAEREKLAGKAEQYAELGFGSW